MNNKDNRYDVIVVGGGSAGCVMAAHLVENDENLNVLLIEAGQDSTADCTDSPLYDASRLVLDQYNWHYQINLDGSYRYFDFLYTGKMRPSNHKVFDYRLGKVLGGSSAVNGAIALRALPSDFESWEKNGCDQWTWEHVLPWYKKIESDIDFGEQEGMHGNNGPLRLKRPDYSLLDPVDKAVISSVMSDFNLPYIQDLNSTNQLVGVGKVPSNVRDVFERLDAYTAFLKPLRTKERFRLLTQAQIDRILIEKNKAVGVVVNVQGEQQVFYAEKIVLCAGAIGTPILLQKSGIADKRLLKHLGIPVVADEPEVGKNLRDHLSTVIWATPSDHAFVGKSPWRQVVTRINSDDLSAEDGIDVQLGLLNNVETQYIPNLAGREKPPALIGASTMLMRPETKGYVYMTKAKGQLRPVIDYPVMESEIDYKVMIKGIRLMWQIIHHEQVKPYFEHIHFWNERLIHNDHVMEHAMKKMMNPAWHACGTVRMGAGNSPVQQDGKLKAVHGIYIADASLFPDIPSMPTNLTTLMVAKRIANSIVSGVFQ